MQSLAEFLGVLNPTQPQAPIAPAPSRKLTPKQFCQEALASPEYRESLMMRIRAGALPPAVEVWMLNTAHGKPVERVEVTDVPLDFDDLTIEQLEDRALRTLEFVRRHRKEIPVGSEPSIH